MKTQKLSIVPQQCSPQVLSHEFIPTSYAEYKRYREQFRQKIPFFEFAFDKLRELRKPDYYKKQLLDSLKKAQDYCHLENMPYPFIADIGYHFVAGYALYLTSECGLMTNTIKGIIQRFVHFISLAKSEGMQVDPSYNEFKIRDEETSGIYLSNDEILKIYYLKGLTKKQEEVRDLFVLGCYTGFRYSDYSTLMPHNFDRERRMIIKKTKKTGQKVMVPMNRHVCAIYDKYQGIPRVRCIQWFNKLIKEICRLAEINEMVLWERTVGGIVETREYCKWELVSSHTARRSLVTNASQEKVPMSIIMKCTGHTTEKSALKYIRSDAEEVATSLSAYRLFR